jgi:hypothetical protein
MSQKLKVVILDASTGEVTERDYTPEEITEHEAFVDKSLKREEKALAIRSSALAKLAALGLTEEEIAAL